MPAWKDDVKAKLDQAKENGDISEELYDEIKEILDAADDIAEFANELNKKKILKKLTKPQQLGWKGFQVIVSILVILIEAGPCPWTGIIAARLVRLREEAEIEDLSDRRKRQLKRLHEMYSRIFVQHSREAYGPGYPKDINFATVSDLTGAGIDERLANAIVSEAREEPFHTLYEALRVEGMNEDTLRTLTSSGFLFGFSGLIVLNRIEFSRTLGGDEEKGRSAPRASRDR